MPSLWVEMSVALMVRLDFSAQVYLALGDLLRLRL